MPQLLTLFFTSDGTRDLKQSDLVGILGSRALPQKSSTEKGGISKAQAKALGEFFHVSPALFLIEGNRQ